MNIVPFSGCERNAKIVCNDYEIIVTLEVGPRVLFFGKTGGPNMFAVHQAEAGLTGGDEFRGYGGHRLWIAPEEPLRTLRPDNDPVEYTLDGEFHVFTSPVDEYHTQKQIRIKADVELTDSSSSIGSTITGLTPSSYLPGLLLSAREE